MKARCDELNWHASQAEAQGATEVACKKWRMALLCLDNVKWEPIHSLTHEAGLINEARQLVVSAAARCDKTLAVLHMFETAARQGATALDMDQIAGEYMQARSALDSARAAAKTAELTWAGTLQAFQEQLDMKRNRVSALIENRGCPRW